MIDHQARVLSGKSWEAFCDSLKAAGDVILRPETPRTEIDRAEGWRYLSRLTRAALESALEFADPDFPVFYSLSHQTIKIGSDNPDNTYRNCVIAGDRQYQIRGKRGTAPMLTFGTKADRYGVDGTMASTGELDAKNMVFEPDGSFEIMLGTQSQPANWLKLEPDSSILIVRETHFDRGTEVPAQMEIKCLNHLKGPIPLSAEKLDRGLQSAAAFVHGTAKTFAEYMAIFKKTPNDWTIMDQRVWNKIGGDPNIFYLWAYWELKEGECLVIEAAIPRCDYWNCQLNNYWDESLDYRYTRIHVNSHTASLNSDGTVTIVIADRDPGFGNFLCTTGHSNGALMWRWVGSKSHPIPKCKIVKAFAGSAFAASGKT